MRLPALIRTIDKTRCSINCQFIKYHGCTARREDQVEKLERDGEGHYLRTEYCRHLASDQWTIREKCPKCKGQCEGEHYSWHTVCTSCDTKFKRIEDQDEHRLEEEE